MPGQEVFLHPNITFCPPRQYSSNQYLPHLSEMTSFPAINMHILTFYPSYQHVPNTQPTSYNTQPPFPTYAQQQPSFNPPQSQYSLNNPFAYPLSYQLQNHQQPIYISYYVSAPPNNASQQQSSLHTHTRTLPSLPTLTSIPTLLSKKNWLAWHEPTLAMINTLHLFPHVCGPAASTTVDIQAIPTYAPSLPQNATPEEQKAYNNWWDDDNLAIFVIRM